MRFTLTAGQKGDAPQADGLIEGLPAEVAWPTQLMMPIVYAKPSLQREHSLSFPTTRHALKYPLDKHLYAQRHLVECCFSKLKQFRRVATRFEKTARNYLAVVTLAAIILWMR